MKLYQLVDAATVINSLCSQELSLQAAWELSRLHNSFAPYLSFFSARERQISELIKTDPIQVNNILEEEVDLPEIKKAKICLSESVKLTAFDIAALEPFVEFTEAHGKPSP